jgi:hypothetical protein
MDMNIFSKAEQATSNRTAGTPIRSKGKARTFSISLRQVVNDISPLPPYSIVIGGCEDGMHFYLTLDDPRPGSILIIG